MEPGGGTMKLNIRGRLISYIATISVIVLCFSLVSSAGTETKNTDHEWTIYYRPAVRFGTDDRTLYINDFLVPLYQNEKDILFSNIKFTPNDQDGWEVNLGLGYRHYFPKANLILGVNCFYDQRKTPWGKIYEQCGVGAEVMADVRIDEYIVVLLYRV
jgi:hypothetical protein